MLYFPSLPTSNCGLLPPVLANLSQQVTELNNNSAASAPTMKQQAVARLTAFVFAGVAAAIDAHIHAISIVLKAPVALIQKAITVVTGYENAISPVFSGTELVRHAGKLHAAIALVFVSLIVGLRNPGLVVTNGRDLGVMTKVQVGSPTKVF